MVPKDSEDGIVIDNLEGTTKLGATLSSGLSSCELLDLSIFFGTNVQIEAETFTSKRIRSRPNIQEMSTGTLDNSKRTISIKGNIWKIVLIRINEFLYLFNERL